MISVKLLSHTNVDPVGLASLAALECYQSEPSEFGKIINVKERLFDVGHHTTLQHFFMTYQIEDVAVGDVTFGLHLTSPFYDSDQRSGRFCSAMFSNPDFGKIEDYIQLFWPNLGSQKIGEIIDYVKCGLGLYCANIEGATNLARKFIKEERPFASEKYIEANAPKFAQEQMRMFIPVIFPTGLVHTINLISLVAMYQSAWSPVMRFITGHMKDQLLAIFPKLSFMFDEQKQRKTDWQTLFTGDKVKKEISYKPSLDIWRPWDFPGKGFIKPESGIMHPLDCLHYQPELMDNGLNGIMTNVEISLATMGQDQRHRTISRSKPFFTGGIYLPPLLKEMRLEKESTELLRKWRELTENIPPTLARIIASYGAMVRYTKRGSFNAVAHEQVKRLCWCAQEEIYHLSRLLRRCFRNEVSDDFRSALAPICYETGVCAEGNRYCGRDIKVRETGDYFPERRV